MATSRPASGALKLLKQEHQEIARLFAELAEAKDPADQVAFATEICRALTIHTVMEERSFYPAIREAIEEDDLLDRAIVEHRSLEALIADLDGSTPEDALFTANLAILKEYVEKHVKEEEKSLFPKIQASDLDLEALRRVLVETKEELESVAFEADESDGTTVSVPRFDVERDAGGKRRPLRATPRDDDR